MNKNIPSLELCKKLKELWREQPPTEYVYDHDRIIQFTTIEKMHYMFPEEYIVAPTIWEMMEVLPATIEEDDFRYHLLIEKTELWYIIDYQDTFHPNFESIKYFEWKSLPNMLVQVLIWLVESGYLDLKESIK